LTGRRVLPAPALPGDESETSLAAGHGAARDCNQAGFDAAATSIMPCSAAAGIPAVATPALDLSSRAAAAAQRVHTGLVRAWPDRAICRGRVKLALPSEAKGRHDRIPLIWS
jgi:hypothetical protein